MPNRNDLQRAFNVIVQHARKGDKCETNAGCWYRSEHNSCFVGVLIANEHYTTELEHNSVTDSRVQHAVRASGYDIETSELEVLQNIHDDLDPHEWPPSLRAYATSRNLEMLA